MSKPSVSPVPGELLPAVHKLSDCWNPHYHVDRKRGFEESPDDATLKEYFPSRELDIVALAPLCVFGGVRVSRYAHHHHASGTFALCNRCKRIRGCGFQDGADWPNTGACECGKRAARSEFFQPVFPGSGISERLRTDPASDLAVVVAEICDLADGKIGNLDLPMSIAFLGTNGHLRSYARVSRFRSIVALGDALSASSRNMRQEWFTLGGDLHWAIRVTERGKCMLRARGFTRRPKAVKALSQFLSQPREVREALAQKALAEQVLQRHAAT